MIDPMTSLPPTDWWRLALLYPHLLLCGLALAMVLQAGVRIATGRFVVEELGRTAHRTALVLIALWASKCCCSRLPARSARATGCSRPSSAWHGLSGGGRSRPC